MLKQTGTITKIARAQLKIFQFKIADGRHIERFIFDRN